MSGTQYFSTHSMSGSAIPTLSLKLNPNRNPSLTQPTNLTNPNCTSKMTKLIF